MAGGLHADWRLFRSGAVDVYCDAGGSGPRAALNRLDQMRFLVGKWSGQSVVEPRWPLKIVLFKPGKSQTLRADGELMLQDGAWTGAWLADEPLPRAWLRAYARELWESTARPMAKPYEAAVLDLLADIEVKATRIQVGAPPPLENRTPEWMLLHLLAATEEYQGRMRVLLSNLQQDAPLRTALKNSYDKPPEEMLAQARAQGASGRYGTAEWIGAPVNPERDYREREISPEQQSLALAAVRRGPERRSAFRALLNGGMKTPAVLEGAGLYGEAVEAGSESAAAWFAAAMEEKDPGRREKLLARAAELNPKWAAPHAIIAGETADLGHKIGRMKKALSLEPRHGEWWGQLAGWQYEGRLYKDSAASYLQAARWADTPAEAARMENRWRELESRRAALEAAERKKVEDEKAAALEKLRLESLERVRAAERKANAKLSGGGPVSSAGNAVEWWDGPAADGKAAGVLERVECARGALTLHVREASGKVTKLAISDPSKVVLAGQGEMTLHCGPQKPARRVRVEYRANTDARAGVAGEAAMIEFTQ
ncbi:MAG: hypothetical protein IT164_13430 [Bryobacterales bacterium]|nr:hypothetical protein [Bryobacterales bacterium]